VARPFLLLFLLCWGCFAYAQRDPTQPQTGQFLQQSEVIEEGPAAVSATLVLVSAERKIAVVNNRVLHIGDEFDGGKVLDINENGVEVLQSDNTINFLPVQSPKATGTWKFIKAYNSETTN
jgi:hypothetical protein